MKMREGSITFFSFSQNFPSSETKGFPLPLRWKHEVIVRFVEIKLSKEGIL